MPLKPEGAQTDFDVRLHGFNHGNSWTSQLWVDIPRIGRMDLASNTYGLCGGMAYAAADTFGSSARRPQSSTPPPQGSAVRAYLFRRQMDSLSANDWFLIRRLLSWMMKPIETNWTGTGLRVLTDRRMKQTIGPDLEQGKPVPICLLRAKASDPVNPLDAFSKNHQVLAIGYRLHTHPEWTAHWDLDIYDPNYRNEVHTLHYHKGFRVQTRRLTVVAGQLQLVRNPERLDRNVVAGFRAYFNTSYSTNRPPWADTSAPTPKRVTFRPPRLVHV